MLFEPIPDNPQIAINSNKILNLSLVPIARPDGYFVLKATQINKEQIYEELIEKHSIGTYIANAKGVILSVNKRFLDIFELKNWKKVAQSVILYLNLNITIQQPIMKFCFLL